MTRRVRLLALFLAAGGAALAGAPIAVAAVSMAAGGQRVTPTTEAWYQSDPTCSLPTGCLTSLVPGLPLTSTATVSPPGTLQVGMTLGFETSRSYLALPFAKLGDRQLRSANLTIPLDVSVADGSLAPTAARVEVCLATAIIHSAVGSAAKPPGVNCKPHVDLTYVAKPAPHLVGSLKPLLNYLAGSRGLALLPDPKGANLTDNWRVVFSTHDRAGKGHPPAASVDVLLAGSTTAAPTPSASPTAHPTPAASASTAPFVGAPGPDLTVPGSGATSTDPTGGAPVIAPSTLPNVDLAGAPHLVTSGFSHPEILLLPLLLAGLGWMIFQALGKDLTPKRR